MKKVYYWMVVLFLIFGTTFELYADQSGSLSVHEVQPYAQLADNVYNVSDASPPSGWALIGSKSLGGGLKAGAYLNIKTKEIVIAFAGTNSIGDIPADLGSFSRQYKEAVEFAKDISSKNSDSHITITGHSLGGALAQYTALSLGLDAYTFNTKGLHYSQIMELDQDTAKKANIKNILTINKDGRVDVAIVASSLIGSFVIKGKIYYLPVDIKYDIFEQHERATIVSAINALAEKNRAENLQKELNNDFFAGLYESKNIGYFTMTATQLNALPIPSVIGEITYYAYRGFDFDHEIEAPSWWIFSANLEKLKYLQIDDGALHKVYTVDGLPTDLQVIELGHNSYMKWGYWMQPNDMTYDSGNKILRFDNKNYWVLGNETSMFQIYTLQTNSIKGTYTGTALGNFWTASGGINMAGSFNAHVDFTKAYNQISNFSVSVSGGGHSVTITNASGGFGGWGPNFQIDVTTGQWEVDGVEADSRGAIGHFYGNKAQAAGGVWLVGASALGKKAYGIFQGTR